MDYVRMNIVYGKNYQASRWHRTFASCCDGDKNYIYPSTVNTYKTVRQLFSGWNHS